MHSVNFVYQRGVIEQKLSQPRSQIEKFDLVTRVHRLLNLLAALQKKTTCFHLRSFQRTHLASEYDSIPSPRPYFGLMSLPRAYLSPEADPSLSRSVIEASSAPLGRAHAAARTQNPQSVVEVKDLQSGVVIAIAHKVR